MYLQKSNQDKSTFEENSGKALALCQNHCKFASFKA